MWPVLFLGTILRPTRLQCATSIMKGEFAMTKTFLTAVSALAIMAAIPAFAETDTPAKPGSKAAADQSTGNLGQDVENAWEDIKEDTSEAYEDIKASLISDDKNAAISTVTINEKMTAEGMIGQPVYNASGNRVAKIKDIILDKNGNAVLVVLADGDFTGLGKTVAFDYDIITRRSADGDVIAPLTEEMIDKAASFSYDQKERSGTVKVIPTDGYSVAELLDGSLIDAKGEKVGDVENISISNGEAGRIIVGFDKVMGLGGEKAALDYDAVNVVRRDDQTQFMLSANQAAKFETFKNRL